MICKTICRTLYWGHFYVQSIQAIVKVSFHRVSLIKNREIKNNAFIEEPNLAEKMGLISL